MNKLKEKFKVNVKKPSDDFYGKVQLKVMNKHHTSLADWGYTHMDISTKNSILDVGCGGGKNIKNFLKMNNLAKVYGIDYSEASVKMTKQMNSGAVKKGRLEVVEGSVEELPYIDFSFDLVTAFETIYFWDIENGFKEVYRVLQNDGRFMIVNEAISESQVPNDFREKVGFHVYTPEQIQDALEKVGFNNIQIDLHENGYWITVVATKS